MNDAEREERMAELEQAAKNPNSREAGTAKAPQENRSNAHRALELRADDISTEAGDRLSDLIDRDVSGTDARYLCAVADPAYETGFAKRLLGGSGPSTALDSDEGGAMLNVGQAMAERAMSIGSDAGGGFAVPFSLDPTINVVNDSAVNPLRELASVETVATNEWRGISSAGVVAAFSDELTEASDNSPTLAQPTVVCEKAQAWVPFSIELGMDYGSLQTELFRVFQDARANLEASVFTNGTGSPQPEGLLVGGTVGVSTAGTAALAVADIYSTQEALAPRWQANASWLGSNAILNKVHRLVARGDQTEAELMSPDRQSILGRPAFEVSEMDATTATGKKVLVYGDVRSAFKICDRIGLSIELAPMVLTSSGLPNGSRGLYAFWRTGSTVVEPSAVQVLTIT